MAKGAREGRLFEGSDYFKYFHQREAIIRGRLLLEGRLLFEEIRTVRWWSNHELINYM